MNPPQYKVTLRVGYTPTWQEKTAAIKMDGFTLQLPHLPRAGDCLRDGDYGIVQVTRVIFDTQGGDITLEIV